jgi:hypothetical protein
MRLLTPQCLLALLLVFAMGCGSCGNGGAECSGGECECSSDADCSDGDACVDGFCEAADCDELGNCRSSALTCYTPCKGPLARPDGTLRACSPEGLMAGCIGGSVCDKGSCIPEAMVSTRSVPDSVAAKLGTCEQDVDCPDYQACLGGRCRSTCSATSDCAAGAECVRTVCRKTCTEETLCEQAGYACVDGNCLPTVAPSSSVVSDVDGTFGVSVNRLDFAGRRDSGTFEISNDTSATQVFTVTKAVERVTSQDGLRVTRASEGNAPLPWVTVGSGQATDVRTRVVIGPGESAEVEIRGARKEGLARWTGELAVEHEDLGKRTITLTYSDDLDGRWTGRIYTFGSFDDGARPELNSNPLDDWTADRRNIALLDDIPNAFLQVWGRFRNNALSIEEWRAIAVSTLQETWASRRVQELCSDAGFGADAVCAPFGGSGSQSVLLYSSAGSVNRVPSGVVELDFAIDMRQATPDEVEAMPGCDGDEACYVGRINSDSALQYGGNPLLTMTLDGDPGDCADSGSGGCRIPLGSFDSTIAVGGRYIPEEGDTGCELRDGLELREVPWLVRAFSPPGAKGEDGPRVATECRDGLLPFAEVAANVDFAAANPVPDGRPRVRRLSLVDALVFEQSQMLLLVREEVESFVDGAPPLVSYAYVELEKQPEEPDPATTVGSPVVDDRGPIGEDALRLSCSAGLVSTVVGRPHDGDLDTLSHQELTNVARAVVRGDTSSSSFQPTTTDQTGESVHYVCIWEEEAVQGTPGVEDDISVIQRQVFDAGPDGTVHCPPGARVVFFALDPSDFGGTFDPAQQPCNQTVPEHCLRSNDSSVSTLDDWVTTGRAIRLMERDRALFANPDPSVAFDLVSHCSDPTSAVCDNDGYDRTAGRVFLGGGQPEVFFSSIETDIREAFAYRTQFASRTGRNIGFAPDVCQGAASLTPYCYDPDVIEDLIARVDCAVGIYDYYLRNDGVFDERDPEDSETLETLRGYLDKNFSQLQTYNPDGDPVVEHGFERLLAELLIMLGDDAYVNAFASRFDLAGQSELAFEGDLFETNGLSLSGGAGYEMYTLYQATQYHEMVLDRFYRLVPALWRALQAPTTAGYVSQRTVTSYLERVTRASTQNAAAWSEIGRRYQALNRPDLARRVLARAYTRSHQESVILSAFMTEVQRAVSPAELAQVITAIADAQRRYRVAMLEMAQAYAQLTDEQNYFGLPPDLIPFPALDDDNVNAFEVMFERARESADVAAEFETAAIEQQRGFDSDAEAFQSELVELRLDYEEQLGNLCGTFVGEDGRVYPAIVRYAHLSPDLARLDDPCGAAGNGELWFKAADLQTRHLELQKVKQELQNQHAEFQDAIDLVGVQCKLIEEDRIAFIQNQKAIDDVQGTIDSIESSLSAIDKVFEAGTKIAEYIADGGGAFAGGYAIGAAAHFVTTTTLEDQIRRKEAKIRERERQYEASVIGRQCDHLKVELGFTLRAIQREIDLTELDVLDATWNIQAELSELKRLNNERQRLESAWGESEQLAINVAAATADPNIRIYKNDAVINSDRTFSRALRDAYRATRVYEYYTASSYADFEKLFLIRLVSAGRPSLGAYLDDLEEAFFRFEGQNGNPDTRVMMVSAKDDIFSIPRYSDDGQNLVLTAQERTELFREKLTSTDVLDEDGYVNLGFSTTFDQLSPLTANHKILFVEVGIFGEELGDNIGRIYLRQEGTGVVRPLEGDNRFFAFRPMTAVLNPVFNGDRSFGQDADGAIAGPTRSIFRSMRFRDRPLVQSQWELVLNQRTESVNTDINLAGVDDIVVTIFYTDFTYGEER